MIGCISMWTGNLGAIPLILIPAVCKEKGSPFGDSNSCNTRGLAYASLSMAVWLHFLTWTWFKNGGGRELGFVNLLPILLLCFRLVASICGHMYTILCVYIHQVRILMNPNWMNCRRVRSLLEKQQKTFQNAAQGPSSL